jgi:hypothetical protein
VLKQRKQPASLGATPRGTLQRSTPRRKQKHPLYNLRAHPPRCEQHGIAAHAACSAVVRPESGADACRIFEVVPRALDRAAHAGRWRKCVRVRARARACVRVCVRARVGARANGGSRRRWGARAERARPRAPQDVVEPNQEGLERLRLARRLGRARRLALRAPVARSVRPYP